MALLLTCAAMGALVLFPRRKPPPFVVLRQPLKFPVSFRDRVGRWIPPTKSWAWAWRLEQGVFGRRKAVNINAEILTLAHSSPDTVSSLVLGIPNFSDTNGLQAWLLGAGELKILREHLKQTHGAAVLLHPRISTADGIEAGLFQGESVLLSGSTNQVGLTLGCFARVRPDSTDLFASILLSEIVSNAAARPGGSSLVSVSIQTNIDAALRAQIPKGCGMFLLDEVPAGSSRKRIGVIIDPPQPKT